MTKFTTPCGQPPTYHSHPSPPTTICGDILVIYQCCFGLLQSSCVLCEFSVYQ